MIQIKKDEYLKMALREFFEELRVLLEAKVVIINKHKGKSQKVISVTPLEFKYLLEDGEKDLSEKDWDEHDWMIFRQSFFFDDGFVI